MPRLWATALLLAGLAQRCAAVALQPSHWDPVRGLETAGLDIGSVDQDSLDTRAVEQNSSGTEAVEQSSSGTGAVEQGGADIGAVAQNYLDRPRVGQDGSDTGPVEQGSPDTEAVEQSSSGIGAAEQSSSDVGAAERNSSDFGVSEQNSSDTVEEIAAAATADPLEAKMRWQATECNKQMDVPGKNMDGVPDFGRANTTVFFRPWNKQMNMVRDSAEWGLKPPYRKMVNDRVKVAFLVFADDRIHNEEIWLHWMAGARAAGLEFSVHIHASGVPPNGTSEWQSERFRQFLVPEQAPVAWCRTWEAQMLLLTSALRDKEVTHMVTLSSDSVPVKPMTWIYDQTSEQPLSRFCVDDFWRDPWPKAEMWSMLRREDALFFHENKAFAESHFRHDCEDELAWYFPLRVRWDNFKEQAPLKRECIMFANWKDGDQACREQWAVNADTCNCPTLRASNSTPASFKHPVAYHDVHKNAFKELLRSPFWFARKFTEGAVPEELGWVFNPASKPKKHDGPLGKLFEILR